MVVDTSRLPRSRSTPGSFAGARAIPAAVVLGAMIAASFVVRLTAALAHASPRYFPDEYIYGALARSLANGELAIRGTPARFPALLEPLLSAPFWIVGGTDVAYRLTLGLHALEMSLAAVPVYLLARRLGLPPWQRLACAALTLVLPTLVFSTYLTADALGLLLALSAVYLGVVALEEPTARAQAAFLATAGLVAFARVQYVVIPVAFVFAALVVSHWRPRAALRSYRITASTLAALIVLGAAFGSDRVLGYYEGVTDLEVSPGSIVHWVALDAALLALASGVVLVPAALVGVGLALGRGASRTERAFASFSAAFGVLLLLEAGVYAANGAGRFQERYLVAIVPLVPILFSLGMRRATTRARRVAIASVALVGAVGVSFLPLSGYTVAEGLQDSPFLQAVSRAELRLGVGTAALTLVIIAGALALAAAAAVLRPRLGTPAALVLAAATLAAGSIAALGYDLEHAEASRDAFLPADKHWVDHAGLGKVAVLVTPYSLRAAVSEQLFWNSSLSRLLQMRGAEDVDAFGSSPVRIARDGAIVADGRAFAGPLLVQEYASAAELDGATLVQRTANTALWRPAGTPRIVTLTSGRYYDGWLASVATVTIWPGASGERAGTLCLRLGMPTAAGTTVDLHAPGVRQTVEIPAGTTRAIPLAVRARRPWALEIAARRPLVASGGRLVSALAATPAFIPAAIDGKASRPTCR